MANELGSTWRKWDLHIHTPESHAAHYGSWERFLEDLADLPPEMSVVGISDYMWVDGYEQVLKAQEEGKLPKIEAIFPVVELRLADFIGTTSRFARLNAHVIFAPGTDPELIRQQFIASLVTSFSLTDRYQDLQMGWTAVATRDALADLGARIKSSVPPEELGNYGSNLEEGFNNWVIPFAEVKKSLANSSFDEPPLLALGKTEWEDIPWNDNTIATKKNLISEADLVFTAAEAPSTCNKAVKKLRDASVNDRLLDCSDAHYFSSSQDKDRLGNCFTWVCADPTLAGLKHALFEYESRIFIGDKPSLLLRQQSDPTNFVSRVRISPVNPDHQPEPAFNVDVPVNGGFIAIIGNKGSGKSALLDSVALAANSHSEPQFSFLSKRRYRNPRNNKAPHYEVRLEMADGLGVGPIVLSHPADFNSPERIRYLPQSLLESLCNKEPGSPDDDFEAELRSIIFSHVPEHERLGCGSLDELLQRRGEALNRDIEHHRSQLSQLNVQIASLEDQARPSRKNTLKASLQAVNQQIANHDSTKPDDPVEPQPSGANAGVVEKIAELRSALADLEEAEAADKKAYASARSRLDAANNLRRELEVFQSSFDDLLQRAAPLAELAEVTLSSIITLSIDKAPIEDSVAEASAKVSDLDAKLGPLGEIALNRNRFKEALDEQQTLLDEPRRRYEQQREVLDAWAAAKKELIGDETTEGTREYLRHQIDLIEGIPSNLEQLRDERLELSRQIHELLQEKVTMYRELYKPVQDFLSANALARDKFSLEFEANLEIKEFTDPFLSDIDRGASGTFYGVEASESRVEERVKSIEPQNWTSVAEFVSEHELDLRFDRRNPNSPSPMDSPATILRKGRRAADVYDFLFGFSYLEAEYELKSDGRPISELSPGQKGTILLMFYLLVDQSGRPIALDQPDENLDNHTIHTLLRPAIREAKGNRQVFVVTHSPNLAIVGDADQVIVALGDGKQFTYQTGSIESPEIRDLVVEVLEGTWPAFRDRARKYSTTNLPAPA